MKKVIILSLIYLSAYAQDTIKVQNYKGKNSVYIQFGGKCGVYSLNYERYFFHKKKIKLSYNLGLCINNFLPVDRGPYIGIPVSLYLNIGKGKGHFSIGINQLVNYQKFTSTNLHSNGYYYDPSYANEEYIELKYALSIGYRHLPKHKGIFYSFEGLIFAPSIILYDKTKSGNGLISDNLFVGSSFFPWTGVSLGYVF